MPNTDAANDHIGKWGDEEERIRSWKSTGGTASRTPVMPPMTKVTMKPTAHNIGTENRTRPPNMVKSQLKILAPVGYRDDHGRNAEEGVYGGARTPW